MDHSANLLSSIGPRGRARGCATQRIAKGTRWKGEKMGADMYQRGVCLRIHGSKTDTINIHEAEARFER